MHEWLPLPNSGCGRGGVCVWSFSSVVQQSIIGTMPPRSRKGLSEERSWVLWCCVMLVVLIVDFLWRIRVTKACPHRTDVVESSGTLPRPCKIVDAVHTTGVTQRLDAQCHRGAPTSEAIFTMVLVSATKMVHAIFGACVMCFALFIEMYSVVAQV